MFDEVKLTQVLRLHEQSYALLQWVRGALDRGSLSFSVVHRSTDSAVAAEEWLRRHRDNLPSEARPTADELPRFARLFAAFLMTSFELQANARTARPTCGCYCWFCRYLVAGPKLRPRNPSRNARKVALELKELYLTR